MNILNKILNFSDLAILLIFISGLLTYVDILHEENYRLKTIIIMDEGMILNTIRLYEYENNILNINLLQCNGVDIIKLDSMSSLFTNVNKMIKVRDSLYLLNRFNNLDNEYNGF